MVALWTAHAQLAISILCHVVVANQALHEDTKVRGPGVEATPRRSSLDSTLESHKATTVLLNR